MFTCNIIKVGNLKTDVSNVIYHKFSYGAATYTLNGEKIKVILELCLGDLSLHFHNYG